MRYIEMMKGGAMYEDSILPCDWLIEGPRDSHIAKKKVLNYFNILNIPRHPRHLSAISLLLSSFTFDLAPF